LFFNVNTDIITLLNYIYQFIEMENMDSNENEMQSGRNPHQKTEENIKITASLASYGVPTLQIAAALEISEPTLFKYYKDDMVKARAMANAKIGQTLYQKARSGDTRALIWWSKTQMGWTETPPQKSHNTLDHDFIEAISDDYKSA
jgi:hypothetical protein